MEIDGNFYIGSNALECRGKSQRQGQQSDSGIARLGKLSCLRNVLAQDKLSLDLFVQPFVLKRRDGCPTVRRMLGIGNGDTPPAGVRKNCQATPNVDAGVLPCPENEATHRIRVQAATFGCSCLLELPGVVDVRCQKDIEGAAISILPKDFPYPSKLHAH